MKKKRLISFVVILVIIIIMLISTTSIKTNSPLTCTLPMKQLFFDEVDEDEYYIWVHDCAKLSEDGGYARVIIGIKVFMNEENELYFINEQSYPETSMLYNEQGQQLSYYDEDITYEGSVMDHVEITNGNNFFVIKEADGKNEIVGEAQYAINQKNKDIPITLTLLNTFDLKVNLKLSRNRQYWVTTRYHIGYEVVDGKLQLTSLEIK